MYHAQLGRFCSRDPVGYEAADANLCQYVGDRPLTFTDPTGRAAVVCECAVYSFDGEYKFEVEANATGLGSAACENACEGVPGASWTGTWRVRGIWGPNWTLDVVALCNRIRASGNRRCCKCLDDCEETFRTLIRYCAIPACSMVSTGDLPNVVQFLF